MFLFPGSLCSLEYFALAPQELRMTIVKMLAFVTQMYILVIHLTTNVLQMATITARVDDELKKKVTHLADEMGISLSTLITVRMRKFLREKKLEVEIDDTHRSWYEDKDMIEVNAPAQEVIAYLDSLQK